MEELSCPRRRRPWLLMLLRAASLGAAVGLAVLYRREIWSALRQALAAGWVMAVVLPLFCIWNYVAARGWRSTLVGACPAGRLPTALRLAVIRVEAQAVNLVLPLASVLGEALRVAMTTRSGIQLAGSTSSVALDNLASIVAGLLFVMLGASTRWPRSPALQLGVCATLAAAPFVLGALLPLLLGGIARLAKLIGRQDLTAPQRALVLLEERRRPLQLGFRRSIGWHAVERLLTAIELWVITYGLGSRLALGETLFVGAALSGFTLVFFFIPAQAGAAEGGLALAFAALGRSSALGLSVALARRGRQLLVGAAGLLLLAMLERKRPDVRGGQDKLQGCSELAAENGKQSHAHPVSTAG